MTTLSESELQLLVESKAVRRLDILQTENSQYRISIKVINRTEPLALITKKRRDREWASLDRLARHIRDRFGSDITIRLFLHPAPSSLVDDRQSGTAGSASGALQPV